MSDESRAAARSALPPDLTGTSVGRFAIRKQLGSGGMGQVYLAEDTTLKRTVAIKRLSEESDHERLIKEAQRASALNHPNIAAVYDVTEFGGDVFLIMEYVEGSTLRARLREKGVTVEEFFAIAEQCAEGLGAAHKKHMVHGDIKPENIMLTSGGRIKILDFGVARHETLTDESTPTVTVRSLTTGVLSGTPAYMAPEVLLEEPHDGRADIFSLGIVFYELLGGAQPFNTPTLTGTISRVLHSEVPGLRMVNPRVPEPIAAIVKRMMARPLAERYPNCDAVLADLKAVQSGATPAVVQKPSERKPVSKRLRYGIGAGVAIAMIVALGIVMWVRGVTGTGARFAIPGLGTAKPKTVAILPIEVQNPDASLAAFDDGLVSVLTSKLTTLSQNHPLQVVSPAELKGKRVSTLDDARKEFGADLGLRLAVQRSATLLRLTYTLVDAKSGRTVNANTIDAPLSDPFLLQDKAANGAAAALGIKLRAEEQRELTAHGTASPEAYAYYVQARGYIDNPVRPENADSALSLLQRALELDPNYGIAEAELGTTYWSKYDATKDQGFVAKANAACSKAIDLGNAGASGHICLGTIKNGTGQYAEAVSEFQKAAELEPSETAALIGLASAYARLGKLDDAENTYQQIINQHPQYWRGYNLLGIFYLGQAQYDKAAAMMRKVIELTPDSFRGYANLGGILIADGKYQEAIDPLQRSLRMHATSGTYSNLGTAYFHLRRFQEAASTYEQALKLDSSRASTIGNLAAAYHYAGNEAASQATYEKAAEQMKQNLTVNPNDADTLRYLADYEQMLRHREAALKYLDRALAVDKADKETLFTAAIVYNHLGETGTALEWLRKALQAGYSLTTVKESPDLDNLHDNPNYQSLVREGQK